MSEKVKFGRSPVFFETFNRKPGVAKKNMHYCPGCGHGILHKLIAEAIDFHGIQKDTMFIAPVGCAVFSYYYFNCGSISVPHGRAPAVGTGIARSQPDSYVISYQGDGDLGAIGFNEFIQAANRGEKITVFFVNNSNYGMTGGQMAPTTLPGQVTTTSPYGRKVETDGFPMKISEIVNALEAPVYIERVALTTTANIQKAKKAVFKGIKNLKERKGFSLIEVLSPCPINLKMNAEEINKFIEEKMMKQFPLGCIRDNSETAVPYIAPPVIRDAEKVRETLFPRRLSEGVAADFRNESPIFDQELRVKLGGFGGQGILSLGKMFADMARLRNFNVTWMPSYGPEQRGGSANCSVILSRNRIPSPMISRDCDLMISMTQTAFDKFGHELKKDGILIYDSSTMKKPDIEAGVIFGIDALQIADKKVGNNKVANSVLLGALAVILEKKGYLVGKDVADYDKVFEEAIRECFSKKPQVIDANIAAYEEGKKAALENL
ncbi:MAG: 2-oxoacid:acceptor oxidoreductase family protein [Lentisphaeria bacterium]|nr:2-oxoacid:acceptor oxidoreductase family protein [Lentisphaeria bacterium]